MGLTNEDLVRRYQAGERLHDLAAAAEMSRSGLYDRLRRLGQPPRATSAGSAADQEIRDALVESGSISAAAKALGVPRDALIADAHRLGLRSRPSRLPADLVERYEEERSLQALAEHYSVSPPTISRWLRSLGVPRQPPGRRPRDG
jgi:transposase-like protein